MCVCVCTWGKEHPLFQTPARTEQPQVGCPEHHLTEVHRLYVLGLLWSYLSNMCAESGSYKYPLEEGEKVILIHISKDKRAFGWACLHQCSTFETSQPQQASLLLKWDVFGTWSHREYTKSGYIQATQKSCTWQCSYISIVELRAGRVESRRSGSKLRCSLHTTFPLPVPK